MARSKDLCAVEYEVFKKLAPLMAELKPLDQIFRPDDVSPAILHSLERLHATASSITLNDAAPEEVHSQFDIARHAYVYAWCYYYFLPVAELYAILAIEAALRARFRASRGITPQDDGPSLRKLLRIAANEGWISDAGFNQNFIEWVDVGDGHEEARLVSPERAPSVTKLVVEHLPNIRNTLAHGRHMVTLQTAFSLERAADIINQLFPITGDSPQRDSHG